MSAPRLLDKRKVNAEVADQKLQQIKEGLNLAKKVDALRETVQVEEGDLSKFRDETIKRVQQEIDAKILERTSLESTNVQLREDRVRLSAPIDLSQAWEEVKAQKIENASWRDRLIQDQVEMFAHQGDNTALSEKLSKKELNIERKDILSERTLIEAESRFEEASRELERAKADSSKLLADVRLKEDDVNIREQQLEEWSQALNEMERKNQAHETDLSSREIKLKVAYETLLKAKNYINSKKK